VIPSRRCLLLLGLWFLWAVAAAAGLLPQQGWRLVGGLLFGLLAADALAALLARAPRLERRLQKVLAVGVAAPVTLEVSTDGRRAARLLLYDDPPPSFRASGLPLRVRLPAGGREVCTYQVVPTERGDWSFGWLTAWRGSPAGFWLLRRRCAAAESVKVYPNFRSLASYTLSAVENRLGRLGIHRRHRRGKGSEFHQLRAYRLGDGPNQIHWKATAKRLQLISREYQDEQDQQVMLLLDCGRRMRARDGDLSHFDHALNALLLLAHVAVRQGDSVGLMTFGGAARHFAPRKGLEVPPALLLATYDLQPTVFASDLAQALEDCAARVHKRSLIVLVSNVADQEPSGLIAAARASRWRHLVLFASLREPVLDELVASPVGDLDDALRVSSAVLYRQTRSAALGRLRAGGLLCIDTTPARLPAALATRYFEIKASRAL
jgi:uncharacterized protein (DUF58 family)